MHVILLAGASNPKPPFRIHRSESTVPNPPFRIHRSESTVPNTHSVVVRLVYLTHSSISDPL
jgi:hypothetical protein